MKHFQTRLTADIEKKIKIMYFINDFEGNVYQDHIKIILNI